MPGREDAEGDDPPWTDRERSVPPGDHAVTAEPAGPDVHRTDRSTESAHGRASPPPACRTVLDNRDIRRGAPHVGDHAIIGSGKEPHASHRCRGSREHEPHRLTTYAADVATAFHTFYDRCPVLSAEETTVGRARLELVRASRIVLRNVLELIGVSAPERM